MQGPLSETLMGEGNMPVSTDRISKANQALMRGETQKGAWCCLESRSDGV